MKKSTYIKCSINRKTYYDDYLLKVVHFLEHFWDVCLLNLDSSWTICVGFTLKCVLDQGDWC